MKIALTTLLAICLCLPLMGADKEKPLPKDLKVLAEKGDAQAQYNLGVMYERGDGVPRDFKKAVKWFRKAAEQEFADAQYNLGVMYGAGKGVPKDFKEALKWHQKAADQGYAHALYYLGLMYARGEGIPLDDWAVYAWINIAATNGNENAKKVKNTLTKSLPPEQITTGEALVKEMLKKNPKLINKQ